MLYGKNSTRRLRGLLGGLCVFCVGLMVVMATTQFVVQDLNQYWYYILLDLGCVIGGLVMCIAAIKRTKMPWDIVELDTETREYIRKRTIQEYVLLAATLACVVITVLGAIPHNVLISLTGLFVGIFAFLGYLIIRISKGMKKREFYEKTPAGIDQKRAYIQQLKISIQQNKIHPTNKYNTILFVLAIVLVGICMGFIAGFTQFILFDWSGYGVYGIAMFILGIFAMLLSLLYLTITYPKGKRPKSLNFPRNKPRIMVLTICFACMAVASTITMAYMYSQVPGTEQSMFVTRNQMIAPTGQSWYNVTNINEVQAPMVFDVEGVAHASCDVEAVIAFSFAIYINGVKETNLSSYNAGLSSCSGNGGSSDASAGWLVTVNSISPGDKLSIEINFTAHPGNSEEYIMINIYRDTSATRMYLNFENIAAIYGGFIFFSALFLLGAGIAALVKRRNPVASPPATSTGEMAMNEIHGQNLENTSGPALTGWSIDEMARSSHPVAPTSLDSGNPDDAFLSIRDPEAPIIITSLPENAGHEQESARLPVDRVTEDQGVNYQVPFEFMVDARSNAYFSIAFACFTIAIFVPFIIFIPAFTLRFPATDIAIASCLLCGIGLLSVLGLLEKTYPKRFPKNHVPSKVNIKRIKTLKILLLFTLIGLTAGAIGSMNLVNQARASEFVVEGHVFTSTPFQQNFSVVIPRTSTDNIGIRFQGDANARCSAVAVINFTFRLYFNNALMKSEHDYLTNTGDCSGQTEQPADASITRAFTTALLKAGDIVNVTMEVYPYAANLNQTVTIFIYYENALTDAYFNQENMMGFFVLPIVAGVLVYVLGWLYPSSYQGKKKKLSPEDAEIMRLMFRRPPAKPGDEDTVGDYVQG